MLRRSDMSTAVIVVVVIVIAISTCITAAPWRDEFLQQRVCGDRLANMLALVCSGRGYNMPFRQSHRKRRQIVEECCHRSCSASMLALYCGPDLPESSTGTPIRKRSENHADVLDSHFEEDIIATTTRISPSQAEVVDIGNNNLLQNKQTTSSSESEPKNMLSQNEKTRNTEKTKPAVHLEKDAQFFMRRNLPLLRHHKNLLRNTRHYHEQSQGYKSKRAKGLFGVSGDLTKTFRIGTVKPYFAGKALASHRNNQILHGPLS
uniref:Insulin-like domain-containing protein n=1 Tax=Homalodisca liturata TaxID=320908 RepID=A0A1B6K7J4_9HEMI